jgi:hypothetical protein
MNDNIENTPRQKSRHGCLTAYLILAIIVNAGVGFYYLIRANYLSQINNVPISFFITLAILGVTNIVCAIALFRWRKWGFWGFCVTTVIGLILNIILGLGVFSIVSSMISIGIMFGILQIGQGNKGWPQLE